MGDKKCAIVIYHKNLNKIYKERWWRKSVYTMLVQSYREFDIYELNYGGGNWSVFDGAEVYQNRYFYNNKFKNHAQAMNFIISEAFNNVDYIFNVNLDDFYHYQRIEKQLDWLNMGYDVVSSDYEYILEFRDEDYVFKKLNYSQENLSECIDNDINIIGHPVVAFNKNFWSKMKYDDKLIPIEDLDMWRRGLKEGFKFGIIPEYLFQYRVHDNQTSYKQTSYKQKSFWKKILRLK